MNKVTAALQLLPIKESVSYEIIDKAISMIAESGLTHQVSPLETAFEGTFEKVLQLINDIYKMVLQEKVPSTLFNIKIHVQNGKDATIAQKMNKYS